MLLSLINPWHPDQYQFNNPKSVSEAKGVLPGVNSYEPFPSLSEYTTNAIGAACRGAVAVTTSAGARTIFAGSAAKLYKFAGATSAWTDVTRSSGGDYSLGDDVFWSFAQFGRTLVAAANGETIQSINIDSGTNFAALGGSPPQADFVETVGDQLFIGNLSTGDNRIQWSGRNDATHWTVGTEDSDFQDFPDGGNIAGITAIGLIFQDDAVRRYVAVDSRAIYAFDRIEDARGLKATRSLGVIGSTALYYGGDGFYAINGQAGGSVPIGFGGVDDWFADTVNLDRLGSVIAAVDPIRRRIAWLFPTSSNTSTTLDHVLFYDLDLKKFTHADVEASFIFPAAVPGLTLENLDNLGYTLDTLPFSLDSAFLQGGTPYLGAFNTSDKLAFFNGSNMPARITTAGVQLVPGRRAFVQGCSPLTDAANATITVGKKEALQDSSYTYGSSVSINAQGKTPQRSSGRIHRARLDIAAGETWSHVQGVDVEYIDDGDR